MQINIPQPVRDPLAGWDINVSVQAGANEKIAYVEVRVNDFRDVEDSPSVPLDTWTRQLNQKGVYPGDNKVEVLVRDQDGNETRSQTNW